ncbi:AraC family transcriptional regulator [Kingella kingae]|uniref:AraC family transcriptional regulator n=1 Tax=Kingella kingae TaxID=504 RepID=UPI00050A2226|nr:AraC family transcriptional regulator [Kingella kingae]MDK4525464.1 AraC family transcriptional regulator [Kingella kingae]MDK4531489.1 AraC family transcriptional regulator [Kingella kingae]
MDILDKWLTLAQCSGSVNIECRFQGRWHVQHQPSEQQMQAVAHIATQGSGYVWVDGETEARYVQAGDVLFFPRATAHILSHDSSCQNGGDAPTSQTDGVFLLNQTQFDGKSSLHLFCATFIYDQQAEIMRSLPDCVMLSMPDAILQPIVALLQHEVAQKQLGSITTVNALSQVLLLALLRQYLLQNEADAPVSGIINAWRDKRLRAVVQAVSHAPEQTWSVEDMTQIAHVSRAQLMRLFKAQMQTSPHTFVNMMRLQKGAYLLRQSQDAVLSVALAVGFQSETHFGKAFKKHYGCTPGQYRKQAIGAISS